MNVNIRHQLGTQYCIRQISDDTAAMYHVWTNIITDIILKDVPLCCNLPVLTLENEGLIITPTL